MVVAFLDLLLTNPISAAVFFLIFYINIFKPWRTERINKSEIKLTHRGPGDTGSHNRWDFNFELHNESKLHWKEYSVEVEFPRHLLERADGLPDVKSRSGMKLWRRSQRDRNGELLIAKSSMSWNLTFLKPEKDEKIDIIIARGVYVHPETQKAYSYEHKIDLIKELYK